MVSSNKTNFLLSLQKKKVREKEKLFVIEGDKLVKEFLAAGKQVHLLVAKPEFLSSLPHEQKEAIIETITASYEELKKISSLKTPHNALAVIPFNDTVFNPDNLFKELSVALDFLQDPGNLGPSIRAAAWFGIKNIICSKDCVDVYNPKVIQASMGAILHVNVFYSDLKEYLHLANKKKVQVFGTYLEGESIYDHKLNNKGVIILGNESKGISPELMPFITDKIMIPGAKMAMPGIESLNAGMAASIVFSEFSRRVFSSPEK
jgi:TrmH family RNA methyltransferase